MIGGFFSDLAEYAREGGFIMIPLMAATLVMWYLIGCRAFLLRRGSNQSIRELVDDGRRGVHARQSGLVDTAVVLALGVEATDQADLRRRLDDILWPAERRIRRYGITIRSIVAVAPLMGLLGTVTGMIETFASLGDMSLFSQSGGIAGGIAQALFTTQMGLAVAVPGLLVGNMLDRRQKSISTDLAQLKDLLCSERVGESS